MLKDINTFPLILILTVSVFCEYGNVKICKESPTKSTSMCLSLWFSIFSPSYMISVISHLPSNFEMFDEHEIKHITNEADTITILNINLKFLCLWIFIIVIIIRPHSYHNEQL